MPRERYFLYKGKTDFPGDQYRILSSEVMASKLYDGQATKLLKRTARAGRDEMLLGRVLPEIRQKTLNTFSTPSAFA